MTELSFHGSFTQQESIPEVAIKAAVDVLPSGWLHRYNLAPGEVGETAQLEREYTVWQDSTFYLADTSAEQAVQVVLRAAGETPGDLVLTNAFTLAPVPRAIHAEDTTGALVPSLNMVKLSALLAENTLGTDSGAGMLALPSVCVTNLFNWMLERLGLRALWPDDGQQMLQAIQLLKVQGRCPKARETLCAASGELARQGATFQLIACFESSLIANSIIPDARAMDTLNVLTPATPGFSLNTSKPEHA